MAQFLIYSLVISSKSSLNEAEVNLLTVRYITAEKIIVN
jgi:hypothetical protein